VALNVLWTLTAQQDRVKVFEYWNNRTNSKDYSRKLNQLIHHRISLIKGFPDSGLITDKKGVKYHIIARHYKLFYKIEEDTAYILRFWDTRQDPESLKL